MDETPWLDADEAKAWRSVVVLQTHLREILSRGLQRDGVSEPDFVVLVNLSEAPERRMRQNELARRTSWEKSRLSHHLRRMAERGLVESVECPEDNRGTFVVLTDAGWEAVTNAAPGHVRLVREAFIDRLTPNEIAVLGELGDRILASACAEALADGEAEPCLDEASS
jgi:DNA-binding MarR family transcriptional regulator